MLNPALFKSSEGIEEVIATLKKRNADPKQAEEIRELAKKRSEITIALEERQAKRNSESKRLGELKAQGKEEEFNALRGEMKTLSDEVAAYKEDADKLEEQFQEVLISLPNLLDASVPEGKDESDNIVVREWGSKPEFSFTPLSHFEVAEKHNLIDFERGVKVAGSRFYVYNEEIARLERKLISFMVDHHADRGYRERQVPFVVKDEAMFGSGQFPKFKDEYYRFERDELNLIPTAEVPLTNLYMDEILTEEELPLNLTAATPCFRREAGSAGRDTRGIIRVHQFMKVEMVKFVLPENSAEELDKLTGDAESILQKLGLHYRVLRLSSGDTSFSSSLTYDLEVWMPGMDRWLEISSCSNFRDFQARRAKIRVKRKESGKNEYLHTLNGSGVAAGRLVAALMETYQTSEGEVDFDKIYKILQ